MMQDRDQLLDVLDLAAAEFELKKPDQVIDKEPPINQLRRGRRPGAPDPIGSFSLVERDGVLYWEDAPPSLAGRRGARRGAAGGDLVATYRFEKLEPNKIGELLEKLDQKLTPSPGLKSVLIESGGAGYEYGKAEVPDQGRVLLFIHGTFSECSAILDQFKATEDGRAFLDYAKTHYQAILAFDHPTLAVTPLLNAFDLQQAFAGKQADVDIIAHSRGGLVARWWLEGFGPARAASARAVFVASPINGTGLASPPRLRATLNLLTNYGRALQLAGHAAAAVPFLQVPLVLMKIVTSVTGVLAKTPVSDAVVAMIPGLACQSRVSNNQELNRLRAKPLIANYYAVTSNFEPATIGWAFWKAFRKDRVADLGADLIFAGENDLVVDTPSMTEFSIGPFPPDRVESFGTNPDVHHINYFGQSRTVDFLRKKLMPV